MLPKHIFLIMISVIRLYEVDCMNWNYTCPSYDYHLNKSLIGNISCTHSSDQKSNIHVKCGMKTTAELVHLISCPQIIYRLDISRNQLEKIEGNAFFKYSKLNILDLSSNRIKNIQYKAFDGLQELQILNLSFNDIATWDTKNIAKQIPSITEINIASNPLLYLKVKDFASLKNIEFKGITSYILPYLGSPCIGCDMRKQENLTRRSTQNRRVNMEYTLIYDCYRSELSFAGHFIAFRGLNVSITCKAVGRRFCRNYGINGINGSWNKYQNFSVEIFDDCLTGINKWAIPNILLGLIAVALSVVTMTTIWSSKSLRKNVNMFLIAIMTIGDFLMGIWLLIVSTTRRLSSSIEFDILKRSWFCKAVFLLFLASQCLSVSLGFLITFERYLCIEYSTKPVPRITKIIAKRLIICVFLFILLAGSLVFALNMKPGGDYSCLNLHVPNDNRLYMDYIGVVGVLLYILCYCLYARLFYVVRKATLNVGIRREGRTAKRILIVVSTNVFFFLTPIIVGQLLIIFDLFNHAQSFVFWNAISMFFLGVNSCLNPVFYAFCNRKFRNELKKHLKCNVQRNVVGIEK